MGEVEKFSIKHNVAERWKKAKDEFDQENVRGSEVAEAPLPRKASEPFSWRKLK